MGLMAIKHLDGSPYNGAVNRYHVAAADATAIYIGDPVKSTGESNADGIPTVTRAVAGDTIRGVVSGISFDGPNNYATEDTQFRPASTEMFLLVVDAPDVIFATQEDAVGGALTTASVGLNADLVMTAGNANSGISGVVIDSSTAINTTAQVRIIRKRQTPDNVIGSVNTTWEVIINEHELKAVAGV